MVNISSSINSSTGFRYGKSLVAISFASCNVLASIYSSEMKDGVEIHNCGEINTGRRFVVFITVRNKIPYVTLSTSADTMFSFGF